MRAPVLLLAALTGTCGCGARSGLIELDEVETIDATIDATADTLPPRDAARRDAHDSTPCVPDTDALAAKIVPGTGSCTTVVRLTRTGSTITGYRLLCAPYSGVDEATAAKQSQSETGVGVAGCFGTKSVTGAKPDDELLFFQGASAAACACCGDGWFTAVSARNAMTLAGGDISFGDGRGLAFPKTFDEPTDLGTACTTSIPLPTTRGFDLTKAAGPGSPPPALSGPIMEAQLRAIWATALPEALGRKQYIFDAMVLLYSPSATTPTEGEFIVLLNSGWLE